MTKLKDKLSANMRMVKANQTQGADKAAPAKSAAPAKPAAKATEKSAPAPQRAPKKSKTVPGDVPDSGSTLFPTRVWPD